ncbi:hypothetical protein GQ457_05G014410 [Hibiscus cannabinus]
MVPPKVKNFLRMLKIDYLPTKEFLSLRGLECEENQSVLRSLWLIAVVVALWSIWIMRNDKIFNKKSALKEGLIENIDEWWESPSNCLRMEQSVMSDRVAEARWDVDEGIVVAFMDNLLDNYPFCTTSFPPVSYHKDSKNSRCSKKKEKEEGKKGKRERKEIAGDNSQTNSNGIYPCDNGYKEVTAFPPRDIVYDQDIQLIGLRDKPITQQDDLPKSESPPRFLLRQDPLSPFEASPLSSCLGRTLKRLQVGWEGKAKLVLESNSRVVLNRLFNPVVHPQKWWETFHEVDKAVRRIRDFSFHHVDCACNLLAINLALEGASQTNMVKAWW